MNIAALSVKYPQITLLLLALMTALGISAFSSIPRSEDPSFPLPIFIVVGVLPGASPEDLEEQVTRPIEDALRELDDIKDVKAVARAGVTQVIIEFNADVDTEEKYSDVLREVERIRPDLPSNLYALEVERARTSNVSVVQLAVHARADAAAGGPSDHQLRQVAEQLEQRLETVAGVRRAEIWAVPEREARVELDLGRIHANRLTVDRVIGALQNSNLNVPAGTVDVGDRTFGVTTEGQARSIDDIANTPITLGPGVSLRLSDLATVSWQSADVDHIGRFNGIPAAFVTVQLGDGQSVVDRAPNLIAAISEVERDLPPGIQISRGFEQDANVNRRLHRLYEDFMIAIGLVLLTLLPLGFRASLVVMISVPLSLALGVAALQFLGFSLNQLSIVGFVIALGLLVDDSIVVIESITRFLREGKSRTEAAIAASKTIGVAVLGCTATLIFAFVPLLFLPGGAGNYIRSLPVAVIVTVMASLLVAFTATPFLASRFLSEKSSHENAFLKALDWVIEKTYARVLGRALKYPKVTMLISALLVVGSLALVPVVGFSLFPKAGIPQFMVRVESQEGASLAATDRAVAFVEQTLGRHRDRIEWTFANVGHGNPQVYYNVQPRPTDERYGEVFAQLRNFDVRESPRFFERLRGELAGYPGARIELVEFENGPPIEAPIVVRVVSSNLDTLRDQAAEVAALLESIPGTRDVNNPLRNLHTDVHAQIDQERAAALGVSTSAVALALRLALGGVEVGQVLSEDGEDSPVRVVSNRGARADFSALSSIFVPSVSGLSVPLSQVVTLPFASSSPLIQRRNGERVSLITAQALPGYNVERLTQLAEARLTRHFSTQSDARFQMAGERESRSESFAGLGSAILIAMFGILAILVLEFRTYRSTLIVATVIPLGFVGGVFALLLTGYTLSFTAVIGFIALVGIEIKNSILLVDATNQLRSEGLSLDKAIQKAGEIRFLPIVLTTATALGGLIPLAVQGSPLYAPLAVVIIGGLLSSTLLARIVTPVAYQLIPPSIDMPSVPAAVAGPVDMVPAE